MASSALSEGKAVQCFDWLRKEVSNSIAMS
jgi:hypothetical protein